MGGRLRTGSCGTAHLLRRSQMSGCRTGTATHFFTDESDHRGQAHAMSYLKWWWWQWTDLFLTPGRMAHEDVGPLPTAFAAVYFVMGFGALSDGFVEIIEQGLCGSRWKAWKATHPPPVPALTSAGRPRRLRRRCITGCASAYSWPHRSWASASISDLDLFGLFRHSGLWAFIFPAFRR